MVFCLSLICRAHSSAVLLFGSPSCGCSSFAQHYATLFKMNHHAQSKSAILRMSITPSFEKFVDFIHANCYTLVSDESGGQLFASCILVIDDVHLSSNSPENQRHSLNNIHEVIRNMLKLQQFVLPVNSFEQSRLLKSNGKSFVQYDSKHVRVLATSLSSAATSSQTSLADIPFARFCWTAACGEICHHIFKTTLAFQMLHLNESVVKSFLDQATCATMHVMFLMHNHSTMSEKSVAFDSFDTSRIAFVTTGEEVHRDCKKGRPGGGRKWLRVEKRASNESSRPQIMLSLSSDSTAAVTYHQISSVHSGVPQNWDKEATPLNFYFTLDKVEVFVFESERAHDWVTGVTFMLSNSRCSRERLRDEWKCNASEKLPVGMNFDLRRLGTVMTYISSACSLSPSIGLDDLWAIWRSALFQAFPLEKIADVPLKKAMHDAFCAYSPRNSDISNVDSTENSKFLHDFSATGPSYSSSVQIEMHATPSIALRSVSEQIPSVSDEHVRLLHMSPTITQFTATLATLLDCRRLFVECSSVDITSAAVVMHACERLGHSPVMFSSFDTTKSFSFSDPMGSIESASPNTDSLRAIQSFHDCLRLCIRSVCSQNRPAALILTASDLKSLQNCCTAMSQVLDHGNCSELFSAAQISALALDIEEQMDFSKKPSFSSALLQKLRGPKNCRAVEELHEYDHVVPLFGLGREVLSCATFFLLSIAARGRVMLGKNATGGSARQDAVIHARLTHDIKILVLAESGKEFEKSLGLLDGDLVSAKLPSLSSSILFNEMLSQFCMASEKPLQNVLNNHQNNHLAQFLGCHPPVVIEALHKCYACAISQVSTVNSFATFQFLEQFKIFYECKIREIQKRSYEDQILSEFEDNQRFLVSLYQNHEESLLQQHQIAKTEVETALKMIVNHSSTIAKKQQILSQLQKENSERLYSKVHHLAATAESFPLYCKSVAEEVHHVDFSALRSVDLDTNQKLVLDAAAIMLSAPVCKCSMMTTPDGLILHAPSHPASLDFFITLQEKGQLASSILKLGQMILNLETLEFLLPVVDLVHFGESEQNHKALRLLMNMILRYASEVNLMAPSQLQKEVQHASAPYESAAMANIKTLECAISTMEHEVSLMNDELDSKMKILQNTQSSLSVVQTSISRISSVSVDLQSWKADQFFQRVRASSSGQSASITVTESESPHVNDSWTQSTQSNYELALHCASLAAFTVFGGSLEAESRLKLLASLQGVDAFSCSTMHPYYQDRFAANSHGYDYVNSTADDATQLLWQQCGMPMHHELFTSVSLLMASAHTPIVCDKTGALLEFLRNMSMCNHSASHDADAPLPPLDSDGKGHHSGLLVRSTLDFPLFKQSCPAAAAFTGFGKLSGAGCVIITLPDSNNIVDKVISACNSGQFLVLRIPAQISHAAAALCSLNAFIPLFLLPKFRNEPQTVHVFDRVITVSARFACLIMNESNLQPQGNVVPLLSMFHFTPSTDAMQQLLLQAFVLHNNKSIISSICVMRQRILCSVVEKDEVQFKLFNALNSLSACAVSNQCHDSETNVSAYSTESTALLFNNLKNIELCLEKLKRSKASLLRSQTLLSQLNSSFLELRPYLHPYHPSLALAAVSSAANMNIMNMYQLFFFLLHTSFVESTASKSSPSKRNKSAKEPSIGTNVASFIFRELCSLIPQNLRLPVVLCALQDYMGGKDGLILLIHTPLPTTFATRKIVKPQQLVSNSVSNAGPVIGSASSSKSSAMSIKKSGKGPASTTVISSAPAPEDISQVVHLCPTWMPIDTYERFTQVICSHALFCMDTLRCLIEFLQYIAENKSAALEAAQDEMLRDENASWQSWFTGPAGPALPPCHHSTCSAFEKLVIVQLYAVTLSLFMRL